MTIRDEEENEYLRKKLLPLKSLAQFVWLGLHKDNNSELCSYLSLSYMSTFSKFCLPEHH